jgi:predicted transposase/invertase (TIGR01784 family)
MDGINIGVVNMGKKEFLPVKSDIIFRLFFADERNEEFLISLLKSVLRLPAIDYNEIEIADPHLLREFKGDKLAIIDVKLYTKTRKVIHIEIQLKVTPELKNRIILYDAKLITEQIGSGNEYDAIQKVASIIITDEEHVQGSPNYHHRFTFYDPEAGVEFSDIIEIHSLELKKLPEQDDGTALYDWAKFIAAESEEELDRAAEKNEEVKKAVVKFRELTADERTRDMYERQEKARRDQDMFLRWGIKQSKFEIAKNFLRMNIPLEQIVMGTGLTLEEIESLKESGAKESRD